MKKKRLDILCLCILLALFYAVSIGNLFQQNRPTYSANEKRTLAAMPEFSWSALLDGSYTDDLNSFLSDTFIGRENLVSASSVLKLLRGFTYSVGDGQTVAILQNAEEEQETAPAELLDRLSDAIAAAETEAAPVTEVTETETAQETVPAETETIPVAEEETAPAETEPAETEPVQVVESVRLSRETLKLTVGAGGVVTAYVQTSDGQGAPVKWYCSDTSIVEVSKNESGGINILALSEGTCTVTCRAGNLEASCEVTVQPVNAITATVEGADFFANGLFIYNDAVYTPGFFSKTNATLYMQTASYYATLFKTRVSVVTAPTSAIVIDNEKIKAMYEDQESIFTEMAKLAPSNVNFVNLYAPLREHKDEYLFFRTDHHWTALGAYYAYREFAQSLGLVPAELSSMTKVIQNAEYHGSMYLYTNDARVRTFSDIIEVYRPAKKCTMTVTTSYGAVVTYDSCFDESNTTYMTFIGGDYPYTVINVPSNPQDQSVLVLKDSFANAFVPYLTEHYGNIYIVDVRYSDMNLYDMFGDAGLTDIIFLNNVQAANSVTWANLYLKAVGVE